MKSVEEALIAGQLIKQERELQQVIKRREQEAEQARRRQELVQRWRMELVESGRIFDVIANAVGRGQDYVTATDIDRFAPADVVAEVLRDVPGISVEVLVDRVHLVPTLFGSADRDEFQTNHFSCKITWGKK